MLRSNFWNCSDIYIYIYIYIVVKERIKVRATEITDIGKKIVNLNIMLYLNHASQELTVH